MELSLSGSLLSVEEWRKGAKQSIINPAISLTPGPIGIRGLAESRTCSKSSFVWTCFKLVVVVTQKQTVP